MRDHRRPHHKVWRSSVPHILKYQFNEGAPSCPVRDCSLTARVLQFILSKLFLPLQANFESGVSAEVESDWMASINFLLEAAPPQSSGYCTTRTASAARLNLLLSLTKIDYRLGRFQHILSTLAPSTAPVIPDWGASAELKRRYHFRLLSSH
jgi:hypothetical protein